MTGILVNSPHKIVTDIMNEVGLGIRWEIDNLCHNSQRMIGRMSHRIKTQIAIDLFDLEEFDRFQ